MFLRRLLMADEIPSGDKAVFAFFELFALAFAFEGAAALLRGESLWRIAGAWTLTVVFFVVGIRWPRWKTRFGPSFSAWVARLSTDARFWLGAGLVLGIALSIVARQLGVMTPRQDDTRTVTPPVASQPSGRPELRLVTSGGNIFQPIDVGMTGITLTTKVWNTGTPTVATEWGLSVIPQGRLPALAQLTKIPEHLRLGGKINSAVVEAAEELDLKTAQTQISAFPVEGVLLFYVHLPLATVRNPATRFELSVQDIYGKETKISKLLGDWMVR